MSDIKETVQDKFSPAAYSYSVSPIHANGEDLQWMVETAALQGYERILDVGCGAGHASLAIAPHAKQVIASDFTPAMLDQVTRLATERGLTNIETRRADAEDLPFESATFDVVISRISAHHWPHPVIALQEFARILKPDGQFILIDCVAPEEPALDTFLQTFELLRDQSHVRDHSVSQWQAMLSQTAFKAKTVRSWEIFVEFDSWIARMSTPALNTATIKKLFDDAPQEARARFQLQPDYSFTLMCAMFQGRIA